MLLLTASWASLVGALLTATPVDAAPLPTGAPLQADGRQLAAVLAWSGSTHGQAGGPPGSSVVIAPFDGRPIRFADAEVVPRTRNENVFEFVVRQDGHPETTYGVDGVIGGGYMLGCGTRGFLTRLPDGTERFYLPAIEEDPGLGRAHFELERVYIRLERFADALPHARCAVEFLPDHGPSRQMLQDLTEVLGDRGGGP